MFTLLQMVMTTGVQEQFTMGWVVTMREKRKIQNMKNCMDKHRKKKGGGTKQVEPKKLSLGHGNGVMVTISC
jgi:hypothetical protein